MSCILRMTFKVKGTSFEGRQQILAHLREFDFEELYLEREPNNKYDPNATKVMVKFRDKKSGTQIGYVPKELAQYLATVIDRRGESFKPMFGQLVRGGKPVKTECDDSEYGSGENFDKPGKTFGVRITITINEKMSPYFRDLGDRCPVCWVLDTEELNKITGKSKCLNCGYIYFSPKYSIMEV